MDIKRTKHFDGIKMVSRPPADNNDHVPQEVLRKEAVERAKQQSLFHKLMYFFKRDKVFKEIIVNGILSEKRVALLDNGILENIETESLNTQHMVGAIFKGKIQNLEPGLKAAFVDIGQDKNAFLHYWDILPSLNAETNERREDDEDIEGIEVIHNNIASPKTKITLQDIPNLFPIGSEIVIQITKTQIGTKGPRTTTNVALPGRYLVLTPYSSQCGISRKIDDARERERLKTILRKLTLPQGMGIIFRTASEGQKIKHFVRDLHLLLNKWEEIQQKAKTSNGTCLLYQEPNIIERTVRDFLTEDVDRVLVDNPTDYEHILAIVKQIAPRSQGKVQLFKENIPIFERFNIETQIEQTFLKRVPLPSGGEIVIEETEALTAIDVNTSSHKVVEKDGLHFILQANLEAAREVARQVRLRNIGGLIVVDFIDMKQSKDRRMLYQFMQKEFKKDKAKTHVLPISPLGIMQITRQRHKESFLSHAYDTCPYCNGEGVLKSPHSLHMAIQRQLVSQLYAQEKSPNRVNLFEIHLHPLVWNYIKARGRNDFASIEKQWNIEIQFYTREDFHMESFTIKAKVKGN